jgi:enoyl-[acyl-carrier protein] reductase III
MAGPDAVIPLPGTVALVTGSSRGIGRATALRLAQAGADTCITYLNSARNARDAAEEVQRLGRRAIAVKADLAEPDDVAELCAIVDREFGRLDVLVSNAAGGGFHAALETTPAQFGYAMRLNVLATLLLAQHARPLLKRTRMARSKIVTVSSLGGSRAIPRYGLIGSSKGALESLTRHLALELGPEGVNVNCVCAGVVDTGALSALPERQEVLAARRKRSLTGGASLTPEDLAGVILFMASPLADQIQGQTIVVDGGGSIQA